MKLLDIRNNLVKISYETHDKIAIGKFIALTNTNCSYVAQIINLKAELNSNFAVAKLLFTFSNEGIIDNYDGTIPSLSSELSYINTKDILNIIPIEKPITLGKLAQQDDTLKIDETLFEKNLLICAEKLENACTLINNTVAQLSDKALIIDTDSTFTEYKSVQFKKDFKLPLNSRMIDFLYENELDGVDATSKAIIQDIFYEVQEYSKTIPNGFIPFDRFLDVVSAQYEETKIPELVLLKQKLLKYKEENIFAQTYEDIKSLKTAVQDNSLSYIDISNADDLIQKELITFIHNEIDSIESYMYCFVKLNNKNSDKKLLRELLDNQHIFTTIICSHDYKYVHELKQKAENVIFFAPQTIQHDFAIYNTFVNKLNANEFVIYGALTQNIPFLVELTELTQDELNEKIENEEFSDNTLIQEENSNSSNNPFSNSFDISQNYGDENSQDLEDKIVTEEEEISNENIIDDDFEEQLNNSFISETNGIDEIQYSTDKQIPSIEDLTQEIEEEEVLTEDDLDFIDGFSDAEQENTDINIEEETIINSSIENDDSETTNNDEYSEIENILETTEDNDYITEQEFINEETEESLENDTEEEIKDETLEEDANIYEESLPSFSEELDTNDEQEELPIYESETIASTSDFAQGDTVKHPKYGNGVIEKLIKYGNKTLCSITFENVGKRLLDPSISEIEKVI